MQGHFPEARQDPVIQIASLVTNFGEKEPVVRNILTLKSCAPICGAGGCTGGRNNDSGLSPVREVWCQM